jgi:anthranilate 1,2-dioxygenase (deaminating, decarboxylating) large subunit
VLEYFRWTHANEIADAKGNENTHFIAPRLNFFPDILQVSVASKWRPFGGGTALSVYFPFVQLNASFAPNSPRTLSSYGFGMGDITLGPIYQSKPFFRSKNGANLAGKKVAQGNAAEPSPFFAYRLQLLFQLPVGGFDTRKNLNPGTGYSAVIPYVGATCLPTRRWEMSTRLHYQYNYSTSRIADPPVIPNLVYKSGQAGQIVYGNFTASYRFTRRLYAGANSYDLYQLNPDKTNGMSVDKARETQAYLGPGGGYDFRENDVLHVNLYLKLEAHNTTSGPALQVQYIHRF